MQLQDAKAHSHTVASFLQMLLGCFEGLRRLLEAFLEEVEVVVGSFQALAYLFVLRYSELEQLVVL